MSLALKLHPRHFLMLQPDGRAHICGDKNLQFVKYNAASGVFAREQNPESLNQTNNSRRRYKLLRLQLALADQAAFIACRYNIESSSLNVVRSVMLSGTSIVKSGRSR
jgi:hypothetical protein